MNNTNATLDYYNTHARSFVGDTAEANMNTIRDHFLEFVPEGGKILDLGCGSGRDSKAFLDAGYDVVSMDGSVEMCKSTETLTGQPVICSTFQEFQTNEQFDGIWACASLLHLEHNAIHDTVKKLAGNLKSGGCFYMSFKYGAFSGERNGRYFTDLNEEGMESVLADINELRLVETRITDDVRPGRSEEKWLNAFYMR